MNNGVKVLIGLIAAIFILALCVVAVAASFIVTRQITRNEAPPLVQERAEQVEEATPLQEATVPLEMPVEPTATAVPEPDEGPAEAQTQPTTEAPAPAAQ